MNYSNYNKGKENNVVVSLILLAILFVLCPFTVVAYDKNNYIKYLSEIGEQCSGVDRNIIFSIIKVESGGNKYCINNNKKNISKCDFANKQDAIKWAYQLDDLNIDVGVMQINYKYWHNKLEVDLDTLLTPEYNVCFGSIILRNYINNNYTELNGWGGIGRYHSSTHHKKINYINNIIRHYNNKRRQSDGK